jgi:hypothetical protein
MTYPSKVDNWIGIVLALVPAGLLLEAGGRRLHPPATGSRSHMETPARRLSRHATGQHFSRTFRRTCLD